MNIFKFLTGGGRFLPARFTKNTEGTTRLTHYFIILCAFVLIALNACTGVLDPTSQPPPLVAVTEIVAVPREVIKGASPILNGIVIPSNASNKSITWTVPAPRDTGAVINKNRLTTTGTGYVTIRATIINGKSEGVNYTQDFTIKVVSNGAAPPPREWRVLWAICPELNVNRVHNTMTEAQINLVKEKAAWFEEFVENSTHGRLNIVITIEVLQNAVTQLASSNRIVMPNADSSRLNPEGNYNSCIFTADYTGIETDGWRAINWGFYMLIPFKQSGYGWEYAASGEWEKMYHTNLYVHEWCHQIERIFSPMPTLHNDTLEYAYTVENTGLGDEYRLVKWYRDYLGGTIEVYPGAKNTLHGVHPDWWGR